MCGRARRSSLWDINLRTIRKRWDAD